MNKEMDKYIKEELEIMKKANEIAQKYSFEIPYYITSELVISKTESEYKNVLALIVLAKRNNNLSEENAKILAEDVKKRYLYGGDGMNDYEEWQELYYKKKIVKIIDELSNEEIEILKRLDIEIEDKEYTEYELERLLMDLGAYYIDDDMSEEELEYTKQLDVKNVSEEEYNAISNKIDEIYNKASKNFARFKLSE